MLLACAAAWKHILGHIARRATRRLCGVDDHHRGVQGSGNKKCLPVRLLFAACAGYMDELCASILGQVKLHVAGKSTSFETAPVVAIFAMPAAGTPAACVAFLWLNNFSTYARISHEVPVLNFLSSSNDVLWRKEAWDELPQHLAAKSFKEGLKDDAFLEEEFPLVKSLKDFAKLATEYRGKEVPKSSALLSQLSRAL